jgi:MYXO-CTERM domain-containing protein
MPRLTITIALLLALGLTPAPALAARWVSYPALLGQITTGPVIRAVINRPPAHVEIKFRDLSEWEATYPRSEQARLQRLLHARHIPVIFATPRHAKHGRPVAVHHHLRYVAAAVLGALALIGVAAYVAWRRRQRERAGAGRAPGS